MILLRFEMPEFVKYKERRWSYSYAWSGKNSGLYIYESTDEPYQAVLVNHEKKVIVTFDKNGVGRLGRRK